MVITYVVSPDETAITCLKCGMVSHHPLDIEQRYCARCRWWHEEPDPLAGVDDAKAKPVRSGGERWT